MVRSASSRRGEGVTEAVTTCHAILAYLHPPLDCRFSTTSP